MQTSPSTNQATYTCSVSGLVVTCQTSGSSVLVRYTYGSVAAARLGLFYDPGFTSQALFGFRGSSVDITTSNLLASYNPNGSNQITTFNLTGAVTSSSTFSGHDANGFPTTISGGTAGTVTHTYGSGDKPTRSAGTVGGQTYDFQFDSNGFSTSSQSGTTIASATTSGTVQMCE